MILELEVAENAIVEVGNILLVIRIRIFYGTLGLGWKAFYFVWRWSIEVEAGRFLFVIRIRVFSGTLGLRLDFSFSWWRECLGRSSKNLVGYPNSCLLRDPGSQVRVGLDFRMHRFKMRGAHELSASVSMHAIACFLACSIGDCANVSACAFECMRYYVCANACVSACVSACVNACISACANACVHACVRAQCDSVCAHWSECECVFVHTHACVHASEYASVYVSAYASAYVSVFASVS